MIRLDVEDERLGYSHLALEDNMSAIAHLTGESYFNHSRKTIKR
jgi:hypothetical protein